MFCPQSELTCHTVYYIPLHVASIMCSKHVETYNKLIMKKNLYIKLVNY